MHLGGDKVYCTVDELRAAINRPPIISEEDEIVTVEVDHKYPSHVWNLLSATDRNLSNVQPVVAVLYGSLASRSALVLHQYLKYAESISTYKVR